MIRPVRCYTDAAALAETVSSADVSAAARVAVEGCEALTNGSSTRETVRRLPLPLEPLCLRLLPLIPKGDTYLQHLGVRKA